MGTTLPIEKQEEPQRIPWKRAAELSAGPKCDLNESLERASNFPNLSKNKKSQPANHLF